MKISSFRIGRIVLFGTGLRFIVCRDGFNEGNSFSARRGELNLNDFQNGLFSFQRERFPVGYGRV